MKGQGRGPRLFGRDDAERRQLEEISHLYFSTPAEKGRPPAPLPEVLPGPALHPRPVLSKRGSGARLAIRPFRVSCLADRRDPSLASRFLYNLALLLRLTQEEVLLLCSERAMQDRFLFAFRPDRERSVRLGSGPAAAGLVGPLGICLLRNRGGAGEGDSAALGGASLVSESMVSFHYVLSDRLATGPFFVAITGVTLLLVTPGSRDDAFRGQGLAERGEAEDEPAHGGIVVAGAQDRDEVRMVYTCWKEMLEARFPGRWRWESYGSFPLPGPPGRAGMAPVLDVIQSPTGWQTKCCLETATLIRRKRMELCGARIGPGEVGGAGGPHPAPGGDGQGGCEECAS